jgi:hypothetical protein
MPPIELLDEDEGLEPEPDGVPNADDDDESELELEPDGVPNPGDDDEGELEPDGVPSPENAAEARAGLGDVNPPGTFITTGGWPPTLSAIEGMPVVSLELSETCDPREPAGCPG